MRPEMTCMVVQRLLCVYHVFHNIMDRYCSCPAAKLITGPFYFNRKNFLLRTHSFIYSEKCSVCFVMSTVNIVTQIQNSRTHTWWDKSSSLQIFKSRFPHSSLLHSITTRIPFSKEATWVTFILAIATSSSSNTFHNSKSKLIYPYLRNPWRRQLICCWCSKQFLRESRTSVWHVLEYMKPDGNSRAKVWNRRLDWVQQQCIQWFPPGMAACIVSYKDASDI